MAILGPEQLPVVLKIDSNPLKFHALSQLGHPVVLVELIESQLEQVLRSTGNFIAHYFPLEERFAFFMTQPLQSEYPLPEDAYWIRSISWDPSTTRIDDIFGAESFLFSHGAFSVLLTTKGPVTCEELSEMKKRPKLKTPFGNRNFLLRWNSRKQPMVEIKTGVGSVKCTPNHPIYINGDYVVASECRIGDCLLSDNNEEYEVLDILETIENGSWSVQTSCGCYFVAYDSDNSYFLVH